MDVSRRCACVCWWQWWSCQTGNSVRLDVQVAGSYDSRRCACRPSQTQWTFNLMSELTQPTYGTCSVCTSLCCVVCTSHPRRLLKPPPFKPSTMRALYRHPHPMPPSHTNDGWMLKQWYCCSSRRHGCAHVCTSLTLQCVTDSVSPLCKRKAAAVLRDSGFQGLQLHVWSECDARAKVELKHRVFVVVVSMTSARCVVVQCCTLRITCAVYLSQGCHSLAVGNRGVRGDVVVVALTLQV